MQTHVRWLVTVAGLALFGLAGPVAAQDGHGYTQVISANPFGLILEFFNAEYERVATESVTYGVGGSFGRGEDTDEFGNDVDSLYYNADVFFRFYPSGSPYEGWNFGAKVGVTRQEGWIDGDESTNFGYGFDANRSWLLGRNNNFYVGVGFGLKRLVGTVPDGATEIIPTFRVVNIGFAF